MVKKTQEPNVEQVPVNDLLPNPRNAKKHDEPQVAKLAGSIREFGFNNPVLIDADNGIIAGHGRVLAAQKLDLQTVPCLRLTHLSETQKQAYILADNRLAELGGGWDMEMLKVELAALADADIDLDALGFGEDFIPEEPNFESGNEGDQGKLDELAPKLVKCPSCNHTFDSRGHEQS
jgi:ParB-like chromosome segregation protein Spo0J